MTTSTTTPWDNAVLAHTSTVRGWEKLPVFAYSDATIAAITSRAARPVGKPRYVAAW